MMPVNPPPVNNPIFGNITTIRENIMPISRPSNIHRTIYQNQGNRLHGGTNCPNIEIDEEEPEIDGDMML
jgi:hypothetical protein